MIPLEELQDPRDEVDIVFFSSDRKDLVVACRRKISLGDDTVSNRLKSGQSIDQVLDCQFRD